jgi:zinc D-Ala-D-Ala carboxypeptidase
MQLSEHFTLEEFIASDTARARGISNHPSPEMLERLKRTAAQMEKIRTILGNKPIQVTSGYRGPELNAAVGGVSNSHHAQAHAVDFHCPAFGSPYDVCKAIEAKQKEVKYDQLIHEQRSWVHVSFAPNPRGQALTLTAAGEYVTGIQK